MINLIKYYLPKDRHEVIAMGLSIVFFLVLFVLVTPVLQKVAIQNIPSSYYLTISEPVTVEKNNYKAGEQVKLIINQNSKITSNSYTVRELILYSEQGREIVIKSDNIVGVVRQGERSIEILFELPNDLKNGNYFIRGLLVFNVMSVEKNIDWISSGFNVD